jgi:hypothetical protein
MAIWGFLLVFATDAQKSRNDILTIAFDRPLINAARLYSSVTTLDSVSAVLNKLFPFADDELKSANARLSKFEAVYLADTLFQLSFQLKKKKATAYCYVKSTGEKKNTAILLIPGSMDNQSYAIYHNLPNYHNTYDNLFELHSAIADSFLYIKPNEDILAIHNGRARLGYEAIFPSLINAGTSYTANYLIQVVALVIISI